jgi:PAP2 superfamily protein
VLTSTLKAFGRHSHYAATFLLAAAIVPAMRLARLPVKFDWPVLLQMYWVVFPLQSILAAIVLYLIGFSAEDTLRPLWSRYNQDKRRFLLLAPFLLVLSLVCAYFASLKVLPYMIVLAIAILEMFDRTQDRPRFLSVALSSALIPALYLFIGIVLLFAYNDVAVSSRPYVSYDAFFEHLDSWILAGGTVPGIVHHAVRYLPLQIYKFLEFVYYYCMFPQVGAALILLAFHCGRKEALRFTGTLLTAYYFAIALFWMWPSQGPFFVCERHFAEFPASLLTYSVQRELLSQASALWAAKGFNSVSLDYYIAFPSMHIAAPLIVAWYLRRRRRILGFLLAVDLLIVVAVVLLEWHYVVDILGGMAVAGLSVLIVDGASGYEGGSLVRSDKGTSVTKSTALA